MKSDRELLELAAKAAGIQVERSRLEDKAFRDLLVRGSVRNPAQTFGSWNPLEDDGDALRLALKLGMLLDMGTPGKMEAVVFVEDNTRRLFEIDPDIKRAIVCLAASLSLHAETKG